MRNRCLSDHSDAAAGKVDVDGQVNRDTFGHVLISAAPYRCTQHNLSIKLRPTSSISSSLKCKPAVRNIGTASFRLWPLSSRCVPGN